MREFRREIRILILASLLSGAVFTDFAYAQKPIKYNKMVRTMLRRDRPIEQVDRSFVDSCFEMISNSKVGKIWGEDYIQGFARDKINNGKYFKGERKERGRFIYNGGYYDNNIAIADDTPEAETAYFIHELGHFLIDNETLPEEVDEMIACVFSADVLGADMTMKYSDDIYKTYMSLGYVLKNTVGEEYFWEQMKDKDGEILKIAAKFDEVQSDMSFGDFYDFLWKTSINRFRFIPENMENVNAKTLVDYVKAKNKRVEILRGR